jgi:hypothetical protein
MLGEEDARELFSAFLRYCLPQYPIIAIGGSDGFDSLRDSQPMLLLAAITAASSAQEGALFMRLHRHLVRLVSDRVVINGERSIELLQAIIVLEVWFCPPDDLRQLNFYQWIHIAATMGMQLGIIGESSQQDDGPSSPASQPDRDSDTARIGLALYLACSS